jgi:hypothetical protein
LPYHLLSCRSYFSEKEMECCISAERSRYEAFERGKDEEKHTLRCRDFNNWQRL